MSNYSEVETAVNRYNYNGVNTLVFDYAFSEPEDLVVIYGETIKELDVDYTATASVEGNGSITLITKPTTGTEVIIIRRTQLIRATDFSTNARFTTALVDSEYDQLLRQISDARNTDTNIRVPSYLTGIFSGEIQNFNPDQVLVITPDGLGIETLDPRDMAGIPDLLSEINTAVSTTNSNVVKTNSDVVKTKADAVTTATNATTSTTQAGIATTKATTATTQATIATNSATLAGDYTSEAEGYKNESYTFKEAALDAQADAEAYASSALSYKNTAGASATASEASRVLSDSRAVDANNAKILAQAARDTTLGYKNLAEDFKDDANTSAIDAANSAQEAVGAVTAVNLPTSLDNQGGKILSVKYDDSGYELVNQLDTLTVVTLLSDEVAAGVVYSDGAEAYTSKNIVYTGASNTNLNFPIGSLVAVWNNNQTDVDLNSKSTLYMSGTSWKEAYSNDWYTARKATGADAKTLIGTWGYRGTTGAQDSSHIAIFQRVL